MLETTGLTLEEKRYKYGEIGLKFKVSGSSCNLKLDGGVRDAKGMCTSKNMAVLVAGSSPRPKTLV